MLTPGIIPMLTSLITGHQSLCSNKGITTALSDWMRIVPIKLIQKVVSTLKRFLSGPRCKLFLDLSFNTIDNLFLSAWNII